jgi:benzodiazapine receptor
MPFKRLINLIAVLVTLLVNGLANALPLNGQTTGTISDRFPVLFTPAGYVFSIWGLIYIGMLAFGIYQALPSQASQARLEHIGWWFALSCFFNSAWIFLWHFNLFPLTLAAMLGLLLCLLIIYLRLQIGVSPVAAGELWLVDLPFSIYLGWISVAFIANFAVVLNYTGWNATDLPAVILTLVVLLAGVGLGIAMTLLRQEIAYPLVLVWAYIGIWLKQILVSPLVGMTALLGAGVLLMVVAIRRLRRAKAKAD